MALHQSSDSDGEEFAQPDLNALLSRYDRMKRGNSDYFEEGEYEHLMDYYADRLMLDKALEVADYAIEQHRYIGIFYIRKAQLLIANETLSEAEDLLAQGEIYDPNELELHVTRSELYTQRGEHKTALRILDLAFDRVSSEDHDELWLAKADVHEDLQQFNEVMACVMSALDLNPSSEEALNRLWLCVELTERYEESIALHRKILDENPYIAFAWHNLGHAYSRLGRYEEAIEAYEFAIVIDETFAQAYRDNAEALCEMGEFRRAISCILDAFEHLQPDADLLVMLGKCYEAMKDHSKAREQYIAAIKIDPQLAEAFFCLGVSFAIEERWQSALPAFRKAIRYMPDNADYYIATGEAYLELNHYDEAYDAFHKATELEPDYASAWVHFTGFLLALEDYESACSVAEEGLGNCEEPALLYCRVAALFLGGRRQEGLVALAEALDRAPDLYAALFDLVPHLENDAIVLSMIAQRGTDLM